MADADLFAIPPIPSQRAQGLHLGLRVSMYALAATHLRDFMQPLGAAAYKAGLTARRYKEERIKDARLRKYAGVVAPLSDRSDTTSVHPLAREWFLSRLPDPSPDPVAMALLDQVPEGRYDDGVITFRLPPGRQLADVEKSFQRCLAPRNLNTFLASRDGKSRLIRAGLPADTRLFTDYFDMGEPRRSLACEIFLIRPNQELAILLRALLLALAP